eukprot:3394887-Rhodomonas_salina.1
MQQQYVCLLACMYERALPEGWCAGPPPQCASPIAGSGPLLTDTERTKHTPVSYTHLTLPTICSV